MLHVKTMLGLGDAFAARPTIAALIRKNHADGQIALHIETPWPQVFEDMGSLHFVKPRNVNIRCATRNIEEYDKSEWVDATEGARRIQLSYSLHKGCKSIPEQIAESAGVLDAVRWADFFWNGPAAKPFGQIDPGPLGVFRVPTIRTEYKNTARNPAPGLVAAAVDEIGGDWIHLNDIGGATEKCDDAEFRRDFMHENARSGERHSGLVVETGEFANASSGELSLPSMLDLVARSRCVVTPVSWMLWAACAYQAPTLAIMGGYCGILTILGPIWEMCDNLHFEEPDGPCRCFNPSHDCAKSIPVERVREAARCLR